MGKANFLSFSKPNENTENTENNDSVAIKELEKEVKEAMQTIQTLALKIETRFGELQEKERRWNELEEKINNNATKEESKVTLNVGMQSN